MDSRIIEIILIGIIILILGITGKMDYEDHCMRDPQCELDK